MCEPDRNSATNPTCGADDADGRRLTFRMDQEERARRSPMPLRGLTSLDLLRWRQLRSYARPSDKRVHFGLGRDPVVKLPAVVTWLNCTEPD